VDMLFGDFEAMFPGGKGEAAGLDNAALSGKPDFDQALIDCMMYDDDRVMALALELLESNYGQRQRLRTALAEVSKVLSDKMLKLACDPRPVDFCVLFSGRSYFFFPSSPLFSPGYSA